MLPQITFRGLAPSAAIVENVWRKARKLAELEPALSGCHVVIEAASRSGQRATRFRVSVQLLGGKRADLRQTRHGQDASVQVALRDAFRAARRQLEGRHEHEHAPEPLGYRADHALIH